MTILKAGDRVQVTLGDQSGIGVVRIASPNGKSLIVDAENEKLPYEGGFAIDPNTQKMVLALLQVSGETFIALQGTQYQIKAL